MKLSRTLGMAALVALGALGSNSNVFAQDETVYGSGGTVSILWGLYTVTCPNSSSSVCATKSDKPSDPQTGGNKSIVQLHHDDGSIELWNAINAIMTPEGNGFQFSLDPNP